MTLQLCPLVIASLLAFETIGLIPNSVQASEISTTTICVWNRDRTPHLASADFLAKKLPGRRQGAGSL